MKIINNTKTPQIRFPGFAENWTKHKLGEIATVEMCRRIFKEETSEIGEVPFYKIGTFGGKADAYISQDIFDEYKEKYSYPQIGDILISASGTIGRTVVYSGELAYYQDSNIVWLNINKAKLCNIFLNQFYQIAKWSGIEGTTIKRLYNSNILDTSISLPSLPEQKKIGEFFQNLDNLIDAEQKKLDNLKQLKKGYLQQLFPQDGEKFPKIRFDGFSDDWQICKLGDVLKEFNRKSSIENEFPILSSTNQGMEIRLGRVSSSSNIGYKIIENGNLVLSPQNLWLGNININDIGVGLVSPSYKTFKLNNIVCEFIKPQLRTPKMIDKYKEASLQGASVVRRNLNMESFNKIEIFIPSLPEQKKIGEFFQNLDNLISAQSDKIEALKQHKKGMLQKMFV